ncbi:alcohol dehydrogenase [Aaosphaeria arxii CBS 175.79]|uniref:Alcohol dehydrogenase n=1 Tax=Aaosphaeria arxii CBS 175.79 TaxID=1450172 RepID=A0A6A5XJE8_9PLEO|nr:alcohol dehydrogenase [Aaosphaeria arxii CBS 175.79]KAF2012996.1 alcohol dehydrogenase [Aaosphaeria arxii CBS 175.79]
MATTTTSTATTAVTSSGQYLHGPKNLQFESRPVSSLQPDEVQVAIRSTTLCGSDVHYYLHFRNGSIQAREPLCLGHESAGQVVNVGSNVSQSRPEINVGDRVALEVGVPCEDCDLCKSGQYNICPSLRFRSSGSKFPHFQGLLQEKVNHPVKWVHKLPDSLSFEIGALLEPLAVAIHAVKRVGPVWDASGHKSCLVFGAGAVGLLCAVAAQAAGCRKVVMADIDEGRLKFALDNGFANAVHVVAPKRGATIEEKLEIARETAGAVGALTWPDGEKIGRVQTTFECSGVESCLQSSIYATQSGGSVVLVGMGIPNHTLPISDASHREVNLITTWRYANAYPRAIEIATASVTGTSINGISLPNVSKLITHRFEGLDSVPVAFEAAGKTRDQNGNLIVKTVVNT